MIKRCYENVYTHAEKDRNASNENLGVVRLLVCMCLSYFRKFFLGHFLIVAGQKLPVVS